MAWLSLIGMHLCHVAIHTGLEANPPTETIFQQKGLSQYHKATHLPCWKLRISDV